MLVTANSPFFIYISLQFCLISALTYFDIGLGTSSKLCFTVRILQCLFYIEQRYIKRIQILQNMFAPVLSQVHLSFISLVSRFFFLNYFKVYSYVAEISVIDVLLQLTKNHIFVTVPDETKLRWRVFLAVLETIQWPQAIQAIWLMSLHFHSQFISRRKYTLRYTNEDR